MKRWGIFFLFIFLLLIFAAIGWVVFTQLRARRAGLEPPSLKSYIPFLGKGSATNYPTPRSAGPLEWIKDQLAKLSNRRTARGAYEETGSGADTSYDASARGAGGARRGRGLEDDAWDTRVGNEDPYGPGPGGYYEEQELGLTPTPGLHQEPYAGGSGGGGGDYVTAGRSGYGYGGEERGRSKSRETGGQPPQPQQHLDPNPFGDQNEAASLRSVSPRPETEAKQAQGTQPGLNTSPSSTRRSMFQEGL